MLAAVWFFPRLLQSGAPDASFTQEVHEPHPLGTSPKANDVRAVAVDRTGAAWAATEEGIFALSPGESEWKEMMKGKERGPGFAAICDTRGEVWIGAWNGLYRATNGNGFEKIAGIEKPISAVGPILGGGILAVGPDGAWRVEKEGEASPESISLPGSPRRIIGAPSGLWIATSLGLHRQSREGVRFLQDEQDLLTPVLNALAVDREGKIWAGGMGGITILREGRREGQLTPTDGLPCSEVRALALAPDGQMWIGTARGVARCDGQKWSLLHGRCWLLDDDVRDIAFDSQGAAWIATAKGVSVIRPLPMTLQDKADRFLQACYARHIRPPGLVEKCLLKKPGDLTSWTPRDDDNDGQYTAMYLAMESFRYAATGDPHARDHARSAFKALKFLQTVTGTDGFFARSVVPGSWKQVSDPNEKISDQEWGNRRVADPREKRVETHWHRSADRRWLWKGDTSSDEATGHFYGYLMFYDLAADENDRREVAEHVGRIMDHIIRNGYVLRDVDGQPTRWGVWSPERLNRDPNWRTERGVNSAEILSFLKVAHHVTGEAKYREQYLLLARKEGYAENARRAKTTNPALRTHIDDELLALAFPGLLLPEDDGDLLAIYRESLEQWHAVFKGEKSPYFNFTYASLGGREGPDLDYSLFFLRDAPLDLIRWKMDNTRREDVQLTRLPEFEHVQTNRLLPPSERGILRWDGNPWIAVEGDDGRTESDGVYWLLPYWMGRYYRYLE